MSIKKGLNNNQKKARKVLRENSIFYREKPKGQKRGETMLENRVDRNEITPSVLNIKLTEKAEKIIFGNKHYYLIEGGRVGGKTHLSIVLSVILMLAHPYMDGIACRVSYGALADSLFSEYASEIGNAEQLNGKSAEYYTNPRNLLDNSDFRNPVNQRGQTSYSGNGNTIDRWNIFSGEGLSDVTLTVNDGYITIESPHAYSGIGQNIPIKDGVYTFAYKVKDGGIIISNGWYSTSIGAYHVEMYVGTGGVLNLEWAALYEGTYTADNLPPYVPKGYAAELAECRRYFYRIKNTRANGFSIFCWGLAESESKFYPQIAIPFGMREDVVASISHNADLRAYYLNSDGLAAVANITEITASSGSATGTITLTVTVEGAPFQKGYHVAIQFADTGYIDVSKDL